MQLAPHLAGRQGPVRFTERRRTDELVRLQRLQQLE